MPLSFVSALRRPLGTALGFSLAINLALLTPSLFMLQVFDRVLSTRSVETLVMLTIIATVTLLTMGFLEHYRSRTLAAVGIALEQAYGPRLLGRLVSTPGSAAQAEGMRDLATLRAFLSGTGIVALFDAPWILIYLAVIYLFHPVLGAVATLSAAFLLLLAWLNERMTRDSLAALHDGHRDTARFVDDALRKSEAVTALGMADAVTARWRRMTQRSHGVQLGVSRRSSLITSSSRVTRQMVQIVMLGVGAYLVIADNATAGVTLAATIILGRALAPVEQLIGGWKSLVDARAAFGRLRPILGADDGPALTPLPRPSGRLEVENLVYTPPGAARPVLAGVSFALPPGQVLALVGASGSGKTTLARLLVGVLPPAYGGVRLDGADLRMWSPVDRGRWIGYVPQNVSLFPGTVSENIARLGEVDADALLAAARLAGAHELILRLPQGYDTPVGEDGGRLSGGQRQRIALARAVYGAPALAVLDEPDASLDAEGEQALLECVRRLKALGTTVVVVSQRRAVLGVADMVAVMKDGKIERLAAREAAAPVTAVAGVARGNLA
jgi:PrtD family type I secretion system ABC transporter